VFAFEDLSTQRDRTEQGFMPPPSGAPPPPSTIEAMVARHVPHPLPAPVRFITSEAVEAPEATHSRIS
jgi:hypothetical protein